eukprot:TRINITY_DN5980_c0_g1_i1.p1 TRINITY_DN5980_c0_g1~~TRINITY_DN5980_c0_g1_i1.p1  ORF type:complete len:450 (-),score=107.59 TRINITY_DN5980_c0_g1_i1:189-1538(-)
MSVAAHTNQSDPRIWSLFAAASVGAATTALSLWLLRRFHTKYADDNKSSEAQGLQKTLNPPSLRNIDADADEEIMKEQLIRNASFMGEENMRKIRGSFVIVVGVGGVGSHAAMMLARSGVGKLRFIDFDEVTVSSLNRHAVAKRADVGLPKVTVLKNHILDVCPRTIVEDVRAMFTDERKEELLGGNPDYILDCIDNIPTKVALLKYCYDQGIPVLSSMGAGCKSDPSKIQIADLNETTADPLAGTIRRSLRKLGIESGINVVYSSEHSKIKLNPLEESTGSTENTDEFQLFPNFRIRTIPVLGTLPAMFGNAMATFCLLELANMQINTTPAKLKINFYQKMHGRLKSRERDIFKRDPKDVKITAEEVGFLYTDVFRGKSLLSGCNSHLALTRWDKSQPGELGNLVLLSNHEAVKHDKLEDYGLEYDTDFIQKIEQKLKQQLERLQIAS